MEDSEENLQNFSFSQPDDEDKYEAIYGQKSKDASVSENSEKLTFGNTDQSELFSTPENYSNIHFFCKECGSIPTIEFISILNFIYTCGCIKKCPIQGKDIIKFFDNTLILEKNEEKDNIQLAEGERSLHYCKECDTSLCDECLSLENFHKLHDILTFNQLMNEANQNLGCLKNNFSLSALPFDKEFSDFLDDNLHIVKEYYIKYLNVLINDYNKYSCYSHFINISNLSKALGIFITSFDNLKKYINEKPSLNLITGIRLIMNNICDITQFCEANLINLKTLNLRGNYISNLESLISAKFKNIEILDFSLNNLGDDNIEKIAQLKFEKLNILKIFGNNFSNFILFDLCSNKIFKNLKILYLFYN